MNSIKCFQCGLVSRFDATSCKGCGASLARHSLAAVGSLSRPAHGAIPTDNLKTGLALCALVVGIISFLTLGLLGIGAIVGIILSVVALNRSNKRATEYGGRGMAIAALVLNISSFALVVPIGIIAAIAIPNLMAARVAANEGNGIYSLRMISAAEGMYYSNHRTFGTLAQLADEQLIDQRLASGDWSGYRFKVVLTPAPIDSPTAGGFEAVCVPITYRTTGRRSFYIDETDVIRGADNFGGDATRFDSPLGRDRATGAATQSSASRDY